MLKKHLFMMFVTLLCCSIAWGQYLIPQSGKAYRILTPGKSYHCMSANYKENIIQTMAKADNAYEQMWVLESAGDKSFYIKNGLTGQYVQHISQLSGYFRMDDTPKEFFINENNKNPGFYNLLCTATESRGMHSDPFNKVVLWYSSTTAGSTSATEWVFEDAGVSIEFLAEQEAKFRAQNDIIKNVDQYNAELAKIFTDRSCSELKSEYAAMSDADLLAVLKEMPDVIQNMALKIKNNTWGKREKEFRVREYKAYANPDEWHKLLQANEYSYLSNPTGIYGAANEMLYIFVEGEIKDGAFLGINEILNTNTSGIVDTLKLGLNIIPVSYDKSTIFVRYDVNTHNSGKVLADYPNLKIHIENGTVNGFFEKGVHTDADWRDITQNLATHHVIQVKGERVLYHMEKKWIAADNCCKDSILHAINWWDNMLRWDHELLGWDKGIYGVKFNNLHCAISLDDDHTYQASTAYRTQYGVRYLYKLLPYEYVQSNHDNVWGPGHELGHTHQGSIQVIGTTELSCNLFANLTMYKMGKYMSRGDTIATLSRDFAQSKPWTSMLGESRMRMWWQLYLYFHMAGNDTEFYPKLFALLREDGIDTSPTHVQGNKDILHFAEKCCEAANMDLTEYFKVWGLFRPINQLTDKEAAWKDLTVTQEMINSTLAKMASYSRKAPAIEFIEDRIKATPRTDGYEGNRFQSDIPLGMCGDVGQFSDYAPGAVPEATGYSYTKVGKTIIIEPGTGAVGFKVYNGKGEYKAMSNTLRFTIPEALAADPGIKIVAAEGDGDEVELKPFALNGTAAELASLKYALSVTDYYMKYSDSYGTRIGYYYANKLAHLKAVKDSAQLAVSKGDQSVHTYGEYVTLLDNALSKVYTANSVIKLQPRNYYSLSPKTNSTYTLEATSTVLRTTKGGNAQNSKKWSFVTNDDSLYYMKTKDGVYIATMPKNNPGTVTTNQAEAAQFRVVSLENGYIYIELDNVHGGCVARKYDDTIYGQEYKSQNSWWIIKVSENNQNAYDTNLLDSMIAKADVVIAELFDTTKLATGDYTLNANILVRADNVVELAKTLIAENALAKEIRSNGITEDYGIAAKAVEKAINAVKVTYNVIPVYPGNITNGITWYYIQNCASDEYLSVEHTAKRYISYLKQVEVASDEEKDDYMLWAFIPTGNNNEYYIFNGGTSCALKGTSNVEAMGGSEALPYTLQLDTMQLGFTIGNAGKFIFGTGTYPKMNTKANYYRLVKATVSDNALLAATSGDIYGRKIYGKKYASENTLFVANKTNATYIDLKAETDAAAWIEKCQESITVSNNIVYYTALSGNIGKNVINKDGNCALFEMNPDAPYYIPETFMAASVVYTDANVDGDAIRPLVLPFTPENKLTTAAPASFGNVDGANRLTLAYTPFAVNTPMFVVADGGAVTATASNVQLPVTTKEDMITDYLLISYVGTTYKISTYLQSGIDKYGKETQAGSLAPFAMNVKSLPGSTNSAMNFALYYDVASGIEDVDADEAGVQTIYDLTGRKVEKITQPGVYIVNKKKVIIREVK